MNAKWLRGNSCLVNIENINGFFIEKQGSSSFILFYIGKDSPEHRIFATFDTFEKALEYLDAVDDILNEFQ